MLASKLKALATGQKGHDSGTVRANSADQVARTKHMLKVVEDEEHFPSREMFDYGLERIFLWNVLDGQCVRDVTRDEIGVQNRGEGDERVPVREEGSRRACDVCGERRFPHSSEAGERD